MTARILTDNGGEIFVCNIVMPAVSDRDDIVEPVALEEGLVKPAQIAAAAVHRDGELLAHDARAAIAARQVGCPNLHVIARRRADAGRDTRFILFERDELMAETHVD